MLLAEGIDIIFWILAGGWGTAPNEVEPEASAGRFSKLVDRGAGVEDVEATAVDRLAGASAGRGGDDLDANFNNEIGEGGCGNSETGECENGQGFLRH